MLVMLCNAVVPAASHCSWQPPAVRAQALPATEVGKDTGTNLKTYATCTYAHADLCILLRT
jgi:hypothetical protein